MINVYRKASKPSHLERSRKIHVDSFCALLVLIGPLSGLRPPLPRFARESCWRLAMLDAFRKTSKPSHLERSRKIYVESFRPFSFQTTPYPSPVSQRFTMRLLAQANQRRAANRPNRHPSAGQYSVGDCRRRIRTEGETSQSGVSEEHPTAMTVGACTLLLQTVGSSEREISQARASGRPRDRSTSTSVSTIKT